MAKLQASKMFYLAVFAAASTGLFFDCWPLRERSTPSQRRLSTLPLPEVTASSASITHPEREQFEELQAFAEDDDKPVVEGATRLLRSGLSSQVRRLEETTVEEKKKPLHPGVAAAIIGAFITGACLCSIICGEFAVCLEHRRARKRQEEQEKLKNCIAAGHVDLDEEEASEPAEVGEEEKADSGTLVVESHENLDLRVAAQSSNPQEAAPPPHVEADAASLATRSSEGADTPRESYEKRVAPQPQPPSGTPPAAPGTKEVNGEANVGHEQNKVPEYSDQPTAPLDSDVLEQWC